MAIDPGRLNVDLLIKQGNLTLTDLSILKNLQVIDDKMAESTGMLSRVINTASNVTFTMADMGVSDCRFLYIESDQEVTVTLTNDPAQGGLANAVYYVTPPSDDPTGQLVDTNIRKVGFCLIKGRAVLTINVANASGNQANVRILGCGYQA